MSKKTVEYLKTLSDEELADVFMITLLGLLGLYQINTNNNFLRLKFKKYKQVLNRISDESIDIYWMIQELYNKKKITFNMALDLVGIFQNFRQQNFTFTLNEEKIKEILRKIPPHLYRLLSSDLKLYYKAYINDVMPITKLTNKLYNFAQRKKYKNIDFVNLAKLMKRIDTSEDK